MTSSTVSDAFFTDALAGSGGMADVPPPRWRPEVFPDALVAPHLDRSPRVEPIPVPVAQPPLPPPPEDWNRDLRTPTAAGSRATSADRAEAARRAAAARRDATIAQRRPVGAGRPAVQPANRRAAPVAATAPAAYPGAVPMSQAGRRPAAYVPSASAVAQPLAPWAPPTPGSAHHPAAIAPAPGTRRSGGPAARSTPYGPARPLPRRAPAATPRKKSGGAWGAIVLVIVILIATGAGSKILDALSNLFNR